MQIPIPDNIRPYVTLIAKHHFWILAAIVPLIVLPLVWIAEGDLATKIKSAQAGIDGKLSSLRSVQSTLPHPNEEWAKTIRKDTLRVKRDTFDTWQRFWNGQQPLRVWPESLGPDFLDRIGRLQPGGKLARSLLERYHDGVRSIVRTLPKRMGAEDLMPTATGSAEGMNRGRVGPLAKPGAGPTPLVRWNAEDQKRLHDAFDWAKAPSTTQVLLAQEEIWMYQILCDVIAGMNARASGSYDAAIPLVEELTVGFPAAEDRPGGAGESRIFRPAKAAGGPADMPFESLPEGGLDGGDLQAKTAVRPSHPRFSGGVGGPPVALAPSVDLGGDLGTVAPASPDDALKNWIYVDFDGKPLSAPDLTAAIANRMIHLIPFRLRVVMDQRRLDELLTQLASASIPIDVRQVRVNPGAVGPGGMRGGSEPGGGDFGVSGDSSRVRRPYDVTVELRGTMAVATPPDRKALFASEAEEEPVEAAQPAPPKPDEPALEPPADDLPAAKPEPAAPPQPDEQPAAAAGEPPP